MTLQCDIRIVADEAKLGIVQVRRGIMPDLHAHWTLPRLVGYARATDLMLTGRMFSGSEAAAMGFGVGECTRMRRCLSELPNWLAIWRPTPRPYRLGYRSDCCGCLHIHPKRSTRLERELHLHLMGTADSKEGVMAFMEKRDPNWTLRISHDWPEWLK